MSKKVYPPEHYLEIAESHLERVKEALEEKEWDDLATYGFYCLEGLVQAASLKDGKKQVKSHREKITQASALTKEHNLPDIAKLLIELNTARKSIAYGDEEFDESTYDLSDLAAQIEDYFDKVSDFVQA